MAFVGIIFWWYGAGWRQAAHGLRIRLESLLDYFSFGLLIQTLFSPFRQISAAGVDGPINVKLRAFADQMISRLVGAFVRSFVLIIGLIAVVLMVVFGGIFLLLWAFVPVFPLFGLILSLSGWVPWTIL